MFGRPLAGSIACLVIAACFQPVFSDHPACGEDGECPVDTRCLHDRCVATGCDSTADGEPCANTNVEDGVCYRHGCVPTGCGDGVLEAGEVCDDGNLVSGDGCSGDCTSNEMCGNGHLDTGMGEQCDDGSVGLSGDGCSSRCTVEALDWRVTTLRTLTPRLGMVLGFDTRRGRMVLFGGATSLSDDSHVAETWEYDGTNWFLRRPQGTPPAGRGGELVFDEHRGRLLLLSYIATWEYDGASWKLRDAPPPPNCRGYVYDPTRQATVCFDGTSTWTYDGTSWSTIATTGQVPASSGQMVFQATTSCDLLFAGKVWALCGAAWSQVATTGTSPFAGTSLLAYDTARDRVVLFDGVETWEFDGVSWQRPAAGSANPPQRTEFAMAFDPVRRRTVLFGGYDQNGKPRGDTWEWDGSAWTEQTRASEAFLGTGGVFDTARGHMLSVVGGETWELDDLSWHRHATAHIPPNGPMVFDDTRGVVVLFAGELWEFDGTDWSHHATAHTPLPGSTTLRMAYDSARHLIVALAHGEVIPAETWIYDGVDWAQTANFPRPNLHESLAFDASSGKVVAFDGSVSVPPFYHEDRNGMFEFDGAVWRGVQTVGPVPAPRESAAMAYDVRRRRLVLFGGQFVTNIPVQTTVVFNDLWEFDGVSWIPQPTAAVPASGGGMIFDATRGHLVLANGTKISTLSYASLAVPPDACIAGSDTDGDGLIACGDATHPPDPDCAGFCTPSCPSWADPSLCDASAPHCGDHVCNASLEIWACPEDCP